MTVVLATAVDTAAVGVTTADALPAADELPELQAHSAIPVPRPMAEIPASLLTYSKRLKFTMFPLSPRLTNLTIDDGRNGLVAVR